MSLPMQLTISLALRVSVTVGYNVSYSFFRGFAEPESGLARWYKF